MQSQRHNKKIRDRVLRQHVHTCQACGADASEVGGQEKMRVGFIPRNDASLVLSDADLKTLCPDCDDGFATATLFPRMNAKAMQQEIHRASASDQIAVLDWLLRKHPQRETK